MNRIPTRIAQSTLHALALLTILSASLYAATRQPGYPVPQVVGPTKPQSVAPGGPGFTLTVYGANFIPGSTVNWDRQGRVTTYVSARELQAEILATDIALPTAGMITVTTTSPKGPITSSTYFQVEVHDARATMGATTEFAYVDVFSWPGGIADFNNDGFLDVAGARGGSHNSDIISDLLNNGKGILHPGSSLTAKEYPYSPYAAFGDFNGDGNIDFVYDAGEVEQQTPTHLAVSFGNGDGTFTQGPAFGLLGKTGPSVPGFWVVGDFNQDGALDIVINGAGNVDYIQTFLGNGDGTFAPAKSTYSGPIEDVLAGDFNGDGKLDLVGVVIDHNNTYIDLRILLGNGDGTFQPPQRIETIPFVVPFDTYFFVNDFNHDGNLDIAFKNSIGQIGILLGNGDGTFQPAIYYTVGQQYFFTFALGDFNSDGNTDIVVQQYDVSTEFSILLGNGDGTFQNPQVLTNSIYPGPAFTVADFNNDGLLDLSMPAGEYFVYLQQ